MNRFTNARGHRHPGDESDYHPFAVRIVRRPPFRGSWVLAPLLILVVLSAGVARSDNDPNEEFDRLTTKCLALGLSGFGASAEDTLVKLQKLADGPLKDQPLRQAEAKGYRAFIYTLLGRFNESEKLYQQTLAIGDRLLPENHPKRSLAYQGLAYLYLQTGRCRESRALFERAATIAEKVFSPDDPELARSLGNLANVHIAEGNFAEAERLVKRAAAIYSKQQDHELVDAHVVYPALGFIYLNEGRYAEAERVLEQLLRARVRLYGADDSRTLWAQNYLALAYRRQRKYAEAERIWKESVKTLRFSNPRSATVLTELAMVYLAQKRYEEAMKTFSRALAIQEKGLPKRHPDIAASLLGLATAEMQQRHAADATRHLDQAIEIFEQAGVNSRDYWECYCIRGSLAWSAGRKDRALADLAQAIALSERQRTRFSGGELERAEAFEQYTDAFEKMIAWQTELGNVAEVFKAMERSRARSLADQLASHAVDLLAGLSKAEAERLSGREREAQLQVASLEKERQTVEGKIFVWPDKRAEELKGVNAKLQNARQAWVEAYADLRNASPAYRLALSRDRQPVDLDRLTRLAAQQKALVLEYFCGQEESHLLIVPSDGPPRLEKLVISDEPAKTLRTSPGPLTVGRLKGLLRNENGTGVLDQLRKTAEQDLDASAARTLAGLYETLIPAAERQSIAGGKYRRLIVCADSTLLPLPFETLVVQADGDVRYLVDVAPPILYAPSATILMNLAERGAAPAGREKGTSGGDNQAGSPHPNLLPKGEGTEQREPVLTVGDCRYTEPSHLDDREAFAQLAPRARYGTRGGQLKPLPNSATEMRWVADVFGEKGVKVAWLKNDMATEAIVRFNAPGRRILHFACHGLVDETYGNLFGALALTPGSNPDDPADDGFLTLAEVYEMNLKGCELAILSACDTNVGPQQRGEGIWALSRGFLVAGARRVVASNWLVDDEAAPNFVSYFTSIIAKAEKEGKTPDYAQAVHDAKLFLRRHQNKKWHNPYYWGTFVLVGPN
jgi:CHAT domain-containing protein/Tfp pilus assembly protein PilF